MTFKSQLINTWTRSEDHIPPNVMTEDDDGVDVGLKQSTKDTTRPFPIPLMLLA